MNYWACFKCDLLFEVDTGQSTDCPQCGRALVRHSPEQIFELSDSTGSKRRAVDARQSDSSPDTASMRARRSFDRTMILPVDRPRDGLSEGPDSVDSVWTSAESSEADFSEPTQVARLSDLNAVKQGPDPTPRQRPRRGPRVRSKSPTPDVHGRRTLDHAQPRPLEDTPDNPTMPPATPKPEEAAVLVDMSLFEQPATRGSDILGPMVEHHLAESVELAAPDAGKKPRKAGTPWGTGITVAVLVGLVVAALLTRPERSVNPAPAIAPQSTRLQPILDGLGIKLLPASGVEKFTDETWLGLGLESARGSIGTIPGLTSLRVLMRFAKQAESGTYVPALAKAFKETLPAPTFGIALDPNATGEDLQIVAQSLKQAGQEKFGLLVERRLDGQIGHFPFVMGTGPVPAAGHAVIQVGDLGVRADVVGRDGSIALPEGRLIKDQGNGQLDFRVLDERLSTLSRRHPLVRVATVYLETGLDIVSIVNLLERVRIGPDKERFVQIRLVVR